MKTRILYSALFTFALLLSPNWVTAQDVDVDSLFQEAQAALQSQDFDVAAEKFQKYTKAVDDNPTAWHLYGFALHSASYGEDGEIDASKLEEAVKIHLKAAEYPEVESFSLYNLGCAFSLLNKPEKSLKYLHLSLDSGFPNLDAFEDDTDLVIVRKTDGFAEIRARAENDGKRPESKKETKKETKKDDKSLVGNWAVTAGSRQGEEIDAAQLPPEIIVTKKDFTIPAGGNQFVMSYKIVDSKGTPKGVLALDFKIEESPDPSATDAAAKAILKIDGNQAKLCYDPTGENRPEKFETTEENGFFMFVMEKKKAKKEKAGFDAAKLVGNWKVVSGKREGAESSDEALAETVSIDEKTITLPFGDEKFVMSYQVNSETSPIQIDMKIESGPAPPGSPAVGILKMEDGKFILCYNAMGPDRPEKFESTEENGFFFFVLKKVD